jgi:hypothetical protein
MTPLIALLLATAQSSFGGALPGEVLTVSGRQGVWRMQVFTKAHPEDSPPRIGYIRCTIRRPALVVSLGRTRGADLQVGGNGSPVAEADVAAIELGGTVYEASLISFQRQLRYSDIEYPPDQAPPPAPIWTDIYLGVRRDSGDPWLPLATLIDEMLDAPSLTLRYRSGTGMRRLSVSLAGLRRAIGWCDTAMESDSARRLHPR